MKILAAEGLKKIKDTLGTSHKVSIYKSEHDKMWNVWIEDDIGIERYNSEFETYHDAVKLYNSIKKAKDIEKLCYDGYQ